MIIVTANLEQSAVKLLLSNLLPVVLNFSQLGVLSDDVSQIATLSALSRKSRQASWNVVLNHNFAFFKPRCL